MGIVAERSYAPAVPVEGHIGKRMKAASVRPSIATPRFLVARRRALVSLGVVLVAVLVGCGEAPTDEVSSARMVELPARSVVYASGDSVGVAVPSGRDIEFLSESGQTVGTTSVEGDIVAVDVSTVGPRVWLEVLTCATPAVIDDTAGRVCRRGEQSVHLFTSEHGAGFSPVWSTALGSVEKVGAVSSMGGPLVVDDAAIVAVWFLRDDTELAVRVEQDGSASEIPAAPGGDIICAASGTVFAASRSMGAGRTFMGYRNGRWRGIENLNTDPDAYDAQLGCSASEAVVFTTSKDRWTISRVDPESLVGDKAESYDGSAQLVTAGQQAAIVVGAFKPSSDAPTASLAVIGASGITRHAIPDDRVRRLMVEGAIPKEGDVDLYPRWVIDIGGRAVAVFVESDVNPDRQAYAWETVDL